MFKRILPAWLLVALLSPCLLPLPVDRAWAFMQGGCGGGECRDCHSLKPEEAREALSGFVDNVLSVTMGPVPGLYLLEVTRGGQRGAVYMDFSKKYVISGQVVHLPTREDITGAKTAAPPTVDVSAIPLTDALVIGNPLALRKVIVFSDPDCHFCAKLHEAIKTVAAKQADVAFYTKLYSRSGNPATIAKVRAILCGKSSQLLDDAFAGKSLPQATCQTSAPEETAKLAGDLAIRGTPTFILPDGRMVRGYRDAETILKLLKDNEPTAAKPAAAKPAARKTKK